MIELLIVVAIIGILATIAVPNFLGFKCKSKTAEAREILKGIYAANLSYYGETEVFTDNFLEFGLDLHVVGANQAVGLYYTYEFTKADFLGFIAEASGVAANLGQFRIGYHGPNSEQNGKITTLVEPCQ